MKPSHSISTLSAAPTSSFNVATTFFNAFPSSTLTSTQKPFFNLFKLSVMAVFSFIFLGCAFNNSRDEMDRRENKDIEEKNNVLRSKYDTITGFYQGVLRAGDEERSVTLGIYILEMPGGKNSSGETILIPTLKAVYRQLFPVEKPIVLDGKFTPETGDLSFASSTTPSIDALHSIDGTINNLHIQGQAKTSNGVLGNIELEFVQKQVDTPSGEENEFNRKLREQYQQLTGTYRGSVVRSASRVEPRREWDTELGLFIVDVQDGTTPNGQAKFKPALKARFKQLSPVAPNVLLDVQYITESKQLLLSTNDKNNPAAANGITSFIGQLNKNTITGQASKSTGYWGDVRMEFISKEVDTPTFGDQEDYQRRLTEEYQTLVGEYRGKVSPKGKSSFEVELKIFIIRELTPTGTIPALKAYYRRTSDEIHASDLTMSMEYKSELTPIEVNMSGQRAIGSATYFVTLNANFQNNEFRGQYHDHLGHEGPFRLKRISTSSQ